MKKIALTLFLFSVSLYAQKPDYSMLTKREKLHFINYYGFIVTISNDTIYCKIGSEKRILFDESLRLKKENKIKVHYPKKLEKYKYLNEIYLGEINKLYYGNTAKYKYIKKVNNKFIILEKIIDGYISVYFRLVLEDKAKFSQNSFYGLTMTGSGSQGFEEIYFEKETKELLRIIGKETLNKIGFLNKEKVRNNFIDFFKDKVDIKELEKIKPKINKLIEFVKKYNDENNVLKE